MVTKTKNVSINTHYSFPEFVLIIELKKFLVIAPSTAKWIVFDTINEYNLFIEFSKGKTITEIIESRTYSLELIIQVVKKIEATNFYLLDASEDAKKCMHLYVTNNCNLRCSHCYMFSGDEINKEELTLLEIKKLIDDFVSIGGKNITFSGGEPLSRDDFKEILVYAKCNSLTNTVLTNGILWEKELIIELSPSIDEVQISIDGPNEETNSIIRGKNNFQKALNTLNLFLELTNLKVSLAMTPTMETLEYYNKYFNAFANNLIKQYPKRLLIKVSLELIPGRSGEINTSEKNTYFNTIRNLINEIYPNFYLENFYKGHSDNTIMKSCGYGELTVSANGDVYPCNRIYEINCCIGNVRRDHIIEIYEKLKIIKQQTSVDNTIPCKYCDIKYICGGGCRIMDYDFKGNIQLIDKEIKQISCTQDKKVEIYRKMILSNDLRFKF